ncbi:FG-nucleoporin nsp1 [Coccidioides posadasii str. Silveira]|uniref:Nucleoporin NSP1 n=2 Tax=Coccidioides posadasii TaxID=199306 RepID=E9D976_COCPS|nr:nucleoporin NSP1 [Coccidioides posadasii str. Silveira]KMM70019.1 Nsp1-like protein [Coccidioides posadasii RMSCC 3488]QVM09209.1 FG-nucleoporin nsp1 [Coccidioides posadasii str. Silveira]
MSNPFQFGKPATTSGESTAPSTSPFGQNASGSSGASGIFGHIGSALTTGPAQPPMFGGAATTQPSSLFGQGSSSSPAFSLKPADQKQPSAPIFGATPNKPAESGQQQGGNLFGEVGKQSSAPSMLGSATPAPASGGLFGSLSTTPAGPPPTSTGQPAFGQAPQSAAGASTLFGAKSATPSTTTASTQPTAAAGGGLFGGAAKSDSTPAFGSGGLFGNIGGDKQAATNQAVKGDGKPNLFAGPASTPTTTTQATGSLFSTPATSAEKPAPPAFSFPSATTSSGTPTTTTTPTAPATGGLFGALGTPKTSAPTDASKTAITQAPPPSLFSLTKPSETTSAAPTLGTTATTPATTSGATTTATTTATSAPTTGAPTTTATTTGTTTAPATTTAGATTLGASTVGPAPPAQSRLKNKTMDEIITRWATDLAKYQKQFQEQAEQVADWDRMLVENITRAQKLYASTVDADRATQEVERQLAAVEGQQDELSSWLDRYEQEVEALLSKQVGAGDTLQGPDQERERTYKLAERLSERLNDMGQDLTSMIEEVNSASANLSKTTKADEPISQIVRILNSHLSQLQLIDQGTAALRAKINTAQMAGSSFNGLQSQYGGYRSGTPGSVSGSAAEDFYRAYMGRR